MKRSGARRVYRGTTAQGGGIFFRLLFLMFLLVVLFLLYLVRQPLLRLAGSFWVVDDGPQHMDAIVMLSDDNFQADRAAHAAELYKEGWAPRVVASGRLLRPYAGIAELEEHDLKDHGVPQGAVVRFPQSGRDTREECTAIGEFVSSRGWKRVLLVTSNYHTRRAKYICSRAFPPGMILRVSPAPDSDYDPDNWWKTRQSAKLFFNETVGMTVAIWELRHSGTHTSEAAVIGHLPRMLSY
jgi:uncharacterized SAM-binding protein YcdF (DUF218 family)